jgi:Protein of unknown function (DUF3631)
MDLPPPNICRRIRKLHGLLGSSNENERENARAKLVELLADYGLSWNDVPEILAATHNTSGGTANTAGATTQQQAATTAPDVNVLDLVLRLIEEHVALTLEQRMAVALWTLHCYVFDRFTITPRLVLLSPVRGCGKTTLLALLELLVANPDKSDNTTPAAIYHSFTRSVPTLLIDEADNLGLATNNVLRAVFNAGHRRGGAIKRFIRGWPRKFPVFAPLALAGIGTLPLPLLHRSIAIHMHRRAPDEPPLRQLDDRDMVFPAARELIQKWAATCSLSEPEIPLGLHNRVADNWHCLLAIADDLGHGASARATAIALSAGRLDEDPAVILLSDIRDIFDALGIDRITSKMLVEQLLAIEDSLWNEWCGLRGDRSPRKLSQGELARLLDPFGIRPRTVWPRYRRPDSGSGRGYYRSQFESAWGKYCPADTATQPRGIIRLLRT